MLAQASALLEQGRAAPAAALAQKVLAAHPDHHAAIALLAHATGQAGHPRQAVELLERAASLAPDNPDYRFQLGMGYLTVGRTDEGESAVRAAIAGHARTPRELERMAAILRNARQHDLALEALHALRDAMPGEPEAAVALCGMYFSARRWEPCLAELDKAIAAHPAYIPLQALKSRVYERMNRLDDARAVMEHAIAIAPDSIEANLELAKLERRDKDFASARARLDHAMRLAPTGKMFIDLAFELGHVLDALGEHDAAFESFTQGNRAWASGRARFVDRAAYPQLIDSLAATDWRAETATWPAERDTLRPAPFFFVGFPRSGTTLAEQILGSHPALVAAPEPPYMHRMMGHARQLLGGRYPAGLAQLTEEQARALEQGFWQGVEQDFPADTLDAQRLLIKMPLDLIHVPLVRRIFPRSRMIMALRDPRDCCLSCVFQQFRPNAAVVHFDTLEGAARLYAQSLGLWEQYKRQIDFRWLEIRYEELVEDLESCARTMIDFLDLPWDPAVLDYSKKARSGVVNTPSYKGVTEGIYKTSRQRWRNYLGPVRAVDHHLRPFIETYAYEPTPNA